MKLELKMALLAAGLLIVGFLLTYSMAGCTHLQAHEDVPCSSGYGRLCSYLELQPNGNLVPVTILVCDNDTALQSWLIEQGTNCKW